MNRAPSQLPLALTHPPEYGRDSFLAGPSNQAALTLIERWPNWPAPVLALSGPAGSGKTHLAHVWAAQSGAAIIAAEAIDPAGPPRFPAKSGLVVEDIAPQRVPEQALFHLINGAGEAGANLLITSRAPVAEWRIELPDLRSRLRMAAAAQLSIPDDGLLRKVLVKLFADRQLVVEKPVLDYLLARMERSLSAAAALVDALDREALAGGRRITRPLAARVLPESTGAAEEFTERE